MPVYEFYCIDCHTIFNFLSRSINTEKRPDCPKCGRRELERRVSLFSFSRGIKEEPVEGLPDMDEERVEKAMMGLAGEMEGINENDPKQMARFIRRLKEAAGLNLGNGMDEMIRRLESGEDPEKIESEMGDLLDAEPSLIFAGVRGMRRRYIPPAHDETLYPL